jgi:hypothetical protein
MSTASPRCRRASPPGPSTPWALLAAGLLLNLSIPAEAVMDIASYPEQRIEEGAQRSVALTIYNDDLALVKDLRRVPLDRGENRLAWRNVSQGIRPETALLRDPAGNLGVTLLEQNFDFDLLTPESLLKKYLGRTVFVVRTNDTGDRTVEEAEVLAYSQGTVLRYEDRIETGVVGHLAFPDVPEDLRDQPTLVLHLQSAASGQVDLELAYLTGGLGWKADYVANLTGDGSAMDLGGWVTLTNSSGVAYWGAQVQLVAGEVNRVRDAPMPPMARAMVVAEAAAPLPEQESLAEYHLYTLPRPTDIQNNQTKQVALLSAPGVPVTRELVVRGQPTPYRSEGEDGWTRQAVESRLSFLNQDGSLGIPLPAGVVRVYAQDSRGNAQFVGEDRMRHTPKGETIDLRLGESFDVTARRKQTSFRKLSGTGAYDYAYEAGFELQIKNAKPEPVEVKVLESIPADWRMLSESQPHTKESASLAVWRVLVPAEGAATLSWQVEVRR